MAVVQRRLLNIERVTLPSSMTARCSDMLKKWLNKHDKAVFDNFSLLQFHSQPSMTNIYQFSIFMTTIKYLCIIYSWAYMINYIIKTFNNICIYVLLNEHFISVASYDFAH